MQNDAFKRLLTGFPGSWGVSGRRDALSASQRRILPHRAFCGSFQSERLPGESFGVGAGLAPPGLRRPCALVDTPHAFEGFIWRCRWGDACARGCEVGVRGAGRIHGA